MLVVCGVRMKRTTNEEIYLLVNNKPVKIFDMPKKIYS